MYDERDYTLACLYVQDRLARAERERLRRMATRERNLRRTGALCLGDALVKAGQWLQAMSGTGSTPRFAGEEFRRTTR